MKNIKIGLGGIKFYDKHGNTLKTGAGLHKIRDRICNWYLDFKLFIIHLISFHVPFHSLRKITFKLAGVKIGSGSTLHMGCKFFEPRGVVIGEDSVIGDRAFLDGRAPLVIGNHVDIASEVMIYNSEHDINDKYFGAIKQKVEIGDYVFIGPRVIILPGVNIGYGAIVGAGAVVTKDIGQFDIVGGIPAQKIGERKNKNLNYILGRSRLFQ
jgi:acetyltransferase-like isoleucine patch superfamily enzyme